MNNIWILANASETATSGISSEPANGTEQTTSTVAQDPGAAAPAEQPPAKKPGLFGSPIFMIAIMAVAMYFLLFRGPRKKQKEHTQMVQKLQKNDRIRTIGGIIGTVIEVKDDEIVLKVDESNNTKIRIAPSAIGTNLSSTKE